MRNGRRIANRHHSNACIRNRPDGRFTTTTRTLHAHFALVHTSFVGLLRRFVSRLLRGEGSSLARAAKAARARRRLRDQVPLEIRNRDHRVIERRRNMHDAIRHVLLFFLPKDLFLSACFSHNFSVQPINYFLPGAFFLAMV